MPNAIAYLSLIAWPVFILYFMNKFDIRLGLIFSVFISYLFLPSGFEINLPGIPAFNKGTVTAVVIAFFLFIKNKGLGFDSLGNFAKLILFFFVISPFITALTNSGSYLHLPGITLYDGLSQSVGNMLVFLPFLFAARFFRTQEDQALLLKCFVIFALIYAIPILYEIRMSPQLHRMLYGYFPHSFAQQMRDGGFRAVVFMGHGLVVALFISMALICLVTLSKAKVKLFSFSNRILFIFLLFVLVLSKSYTALIFFIFAFCVLQLSKFRTVGLIAFSLMLLFMFYPVLSANKLFPHDKLVSIAYDISPERAQSLGFRFANEEQLLAHADVKPVFGWGSWGRNRVYDPETFEDLSVTDGRWIITLGVRGWFGFFSEFYFIFATIWLAFALSRNDKLLLKESRVLLSGHLLIVALLLIDQLPNSSLNYFYWFIIGALYGRVSELTSESKRKLGVT